MSRKHYTCTFDEKIAVAFKKKCLDQGIAFSRALEGLMRNELDMTDSANLSLSFVQRRLSEACEAVGMEATYIRKDADEQEDEDF